MLALIPAELKNPHITRADMSKEAWLHLDAAATKLEKLGWGGDEVNTATIDILFMGRVIYHGIQLTAAHIDDLLQRRIGRSDALRCA